MRKAAIILSLLCALKVCVQVHGRYLLQVRLNAYENQDNTCIGCVPDEGTDRGCCDDHRRYNDCDKGDRPCDSYFMFCLRPSGGERMREPGCRNYRDTKITSVNTNDRPVNFTNATVLGLENPFLLLGLTEEYEGVQLFIAVYDEDMGTTSGPLGANEPDDLVDILVIDHNQSVNMQSQIRSTGTIMSINVNITVLCAQNFQGADCTQCVQPGFTGPNCDVNIDKCVAMNCSGNGQCVYNSTSGSLSCNCNVGYTGDRCQTNIDDCIGVNCSGNGQCLDGVNSFTCECITGYSGPVCEEDQSVAIGGSAITPVGALVGGVAGALLLLILILLLLTVACLRRKSEVMHRHSELTPQQVQSDQMFELKSNEAYASITHYIPTEDNVAYGQTTPHISTEDNVAYGRTASHGHNISTEDSSIYTQIPTSN